MHPSFIKVSEEKQRNIINAALNEFSKHPYETASTNKIVKEAGISKGILFRYFGNKKSLYLFLYEYVLDKLSEAIFADLKLADPDVFERYKQLISMKMNLVQQNPAFFHFMNRVLIEKSPEVTTELEKIQSLKEENNYDKFLTDIDYSFFKEEIDTKYALDTIKWVLDGISNRYDQQLKESIHDIDSFNTLIDQCTVEIEEYFHFLKPLFYK
ncbi:TetR/AcrR family transcriptional regulator [Lysinibacillus sp. NPDC097287]|uniref:TetR/AcrR family transcriptional regulator n=1 Tax=Lysinibacillus sp. NPDC097287 TaxID=3364144 RepID=UPI003821DE96